MSSSKAVNRTNPKHSVIDIKSVIELLLEKDYTMWTIARAAGVSFSTVWRWKEGKVIPKLDAVNRLLKVLNES